MSASPPACRLCGHQDGNRLWTANEKMFGLGGAFHYLECGACGCLQLLDPPSDLTPYYPGRYHSLKPQPPAGPVHSRRFHRRRRAALAPLSSLRATPASNILDVGCGTGALLLRMAESGFQHLEGVEPFLDADLAYPNGVRIYRGELTDLPRKPWNLIMLHHSFEHMPDPAGVLAAIAERLDTNGECLIRVPVAGSWAWRRYGVNWVQLDAPRHLYLHTEASLTRLAAAAGLRVRQVQYDSTDFQFWGSEMYEAGLPLVAPPGTSRWTLRRRRWLRHLHVRLRRLKAQAERLNRQGQGDTAAFLLEKATF